MQRRYVLAGAATVALTVVSVAAVAATQPAPFYRPGRAVMHGVAWSSAGVPAMMGGAALASRCAVPTLSGQQVSVVAGDMTGAGMMGSGWMMRGRMMLYAAPQTVRAGAVSLRVVNHGFLTHEVLVLPLASGASVGSRAVGSDNRIDETGSLGEASKDCGAGSGDGIKPGDAGWVTVTLKPGRYELVCNLPGHYAAGMYAELDVT